MVQRTGNCGFVMGKDFRLGTWNVPSTPQLAVDPGVPVSSSTAFLKAM
jgi:hypothetical protein